MGYTGDKKREYQRNWLRNKRDAWIEEHGPCKECGSEINLELHHIDEKDPSLATHMGSSIFSMRKDKQELELAKCIVLCEECHKRVTAENAGHLMHGTHSMYTNHGCRCSVCREHHALEARLYREKHGR